MQRCLFLSKKLTSCNISFYKELDRRVSSFPLIQDGYFLKLFKIWLAKCFVMPNMMPNAIMATLGCSFSLYFLFYFSFKLVVMRTTALA